jgi:hypothetical protein
LIESEIEFMMFLHIGEGRYGRVDCLPGLFHVETSFLHTYGIPVFPLRSHVIFTCRRNFDWTMPLAWKSVLAGYLRSWSFLSGIIFTLINLSIFRNFLGNRLPELNWSFLALMAGCWMIFFISLRFPRPTPHRAMELARILDIPVEALAEFYLDDPRLLELLEQRQSGE